MRVDVVLFALGVLAGAAAGFFSPWWYSGFLPLAVGLVWASDNLVEVAPSADPPSATQRT